MIKFYYSLLANFICIICLAQTTVNPFDTHRNEFNQRDIISVFKQPNQNVKQQILAYDWIQAFNQNTWSNIEPRSGDPQELSANSSGYIVVETGSFNDDEKDDVFYLNEYLGKWTYAAADQVQVFNEEDSLYNFVLSTPGFTDGAPIAGNHSFPAFTLGDFDGDGTDEGAVAWAEGNNFNIYIQIIDILDQGGMFTCNPLPVYSTGEVSERINTRHALAITAGDFNGDGTDEIAVSGVEDNTTDLAVEYNAYVKLFDVSEDGNLNIIDGPKQLFDSSNLLVEISQDGGSLNYVRTTLEAVRPYATHDADGGQESIFAALGADYQGEPNNFDYDHLHTYHLQPQGNLSSITVTPGPSIGTEYYHFMFNSPFESHRGEVNDDLIDDVVVLLDRFVIFTFNDEGEIIIGNNGNIGTTTPILDFDNNPYEESVDRFDVGDVNRDGIDDIICQTKQFSGSGQGQHTYYVQAFQTGYNEFTESDFHLEQSGFYEFEYESGQSMTNYGFAMGNLDGNDLCLGDPISYDCEYYKPFIILEAIPNHFDLINDTELDVNNCYSYDVPTACGNVVSFTYSTTDESSSSMQVSRDWSVSAEVSSGFALGGFGMNASLGYKYGEQFTSTSSESSGFTFSIITSAESDDRMGYYSFPFTMLEYPVLSSVGDTVTWIVAAFPNQVGAVKLYKPSKSLYNYIPNHEVGNVLSYPKPGSEDLTYDKSDDPNWEIYTFQDPISLSTGGSENVQFEEFVNSGLENSSTTTQTISASVGANGMGIGASVNGEYTESETKIFGQSLSSAESYVIDPVQIISDGWSFDIYPKLYWTRDRAPKLAMSVDFSSAGPLWMQTYGQQVDPALNMPYKFEDLHTSSYIASDLDRTKSVYFDKINPNPGDTVTAFIKIFNYSLMSMDEEVPFSIFNGHPDMGGTIIEDLDGNTLFYTSEILEDQGRSSQSVSFVVSPDMIGNGTVKIYFQLDPNDEIAEIHEENNLGWTNLGYVCNTPGGVLSVGDFLVNDHQFEFRVFPNPGANQVNIDFKDALNYIHENVTLSVYNISGQLQHQIKVGNATNGTFSFDISELPNGPYLIQVHTSSEVIFNSKLIVLR